MHDTLLIDPNSCGTLWSERWGGALSLPNTERGQIVYRWMLDNPSLLGVSEIVFRSMLDPELVTTSDVAVAAKAFLIARFGGQVFLGLTWIGEFADRGGPFYAYVRRGNVPFAYNGPLLKMFALDPNELHARWKEVRDDFERTPSDVRIPRLMSGLRRDLSRFETVSGLRVPTAALLSVNCFVEDNMRGLFLNGEAALPDLSPRQVANFMHVMRHEGAKRAGQVFPNAR